MTKELMCFSSAITGLHLLVILGLEQTVEAEAQVAYVQRKHCLLPEWGTNMPYHHLENRAVSSGGETTLQEFPFKHG